MKKIVTPFFAISAGVILLAALTTSNQVHSNASGAPSSNSCTSCHNTTVQTSMDVVLNIFDTATFTTPTSYTPGKTYGVTIGMVRPAIQRYGFALSATAGTLNPLVGDNTIQKINNYLTHTSSGSFADNNGAIEWEGRWTAPQSGTANFQLYINATNNDGTNTGDQIFSKQVSLNAAPPTGLPSVMSNAGLHIFPMPATNYINLEYELKASTYVRITVYDLSGKIVTTMFEGTQNSGLQEINLNTEQFNKGIYMLQMQLDNEQVTRKIIIQ